MTRVQGVRVTLGKWYYYCFQAANGCCMCAAAVTVTLFLLYSPRGSEPLGLAAVAGLLFAGVNVWIAFEIPVSDPRWRSKRAMRVLFLFGVWVEGTADVASGIAAIRQGLAAFGIPVIVAGVQPVGLCNASQVRILTNTTGSGSADVVHTASPVCAKQFAVCTHVLR